MYKEKLRESFKVYDEIVLKCFCGIFIGAIVAICEVIFGKGLEWILNLREHMGCIMLLGLPFAGLAIVFLFDHWGRISRKGMGLVFEVDQGKSDWIPLRMAPFWSCRHGLPTSLVVVRVEKVLRCRLELPYRIILVSISALKTVVLSLWLQVWQLVLPVYLVRQLRLFSLP